MIVSRLSNSGRQPRCMRILSEAATIAAGSPARRGDKRTSKSAPASVNVTVGTGTTSVSFGNYCFDAPSGGHTLGFWRNQNGKAILQAHDPAWRTLLNGLNLRTSTGADFVVPGGSFNDAFTALSLWLQGANGTNMAYMLSAQLAANVLFSFEYRETKGGPIRPGQPTPNRFETLELKLEINF